MKYSAKEVYKDKKLVMGYDNNRFRSLLGKWVDLLEKKRMLEGLQQILGKEDKCLILDAPGGTGRLTYELLTQTYQVLEIDISFEMLKRSKAAHQSLSGNGLLGYVCCDLEHLPFSNKSVDVTASLRVMGHLPPDVKRNVFQEFSRVSRYGVVAMMVMGNVFLRFKRSIINFLKLRPNTVMWFPTTHSHIINISDSTNMQFLHCRDLLYLFSESRCYTFRVKPGK